MPRMETHLVSSLLINQRQAGSQILSIFQHVKALADARSTYHAYRRFYLPAISWRKWLRTGGERDANVLPENARREARAGHGLLEDKRNMGIYDDDSASTREDHLDVGIRPVRTVSTVAGTVPIRKGPQRAEASTIVWLRGVAADYIEFLAESDSLSFALKLSIATFAVTWPAFVPSLNAWFSSVRGTWATLQLILVFEVSVGTSFQSFFFRAIGTVVGCTVGYLAYLIGSGNKIVAIIVLVVGLVPSVYMQVATPYVKTGIISITSLAVICLCKF